MTLKHIITITAKAIEYRNYNIYFQILCEMNSTLSLVGNHLLCLWRFESYTTRLFSSLRPATIL